MRPPRSIRQEHPRSLSRSTSADGIALRRVLSEHNPRAMVRIPAYRRRYPEIGSLMRGKSALLIGIVVGVVLGNTRQGRSAFRAAGERVSRLWNDSRVQQRVDDIQAQVKERVPVVGDEIAEAIDRVKPAPRTKPATSSGTDPLGGVGAANLG
jgi:hypothetical protein